MGRILHSQRLRYRYIRFCHVSLARCRFLCIRFCLRFTLDKETDMAHPCAANPELWFGYPDDDGGDGAAKARAYERSATEARIQCLRRCPLAQQRRCAAHAIANREEYGVWAGVKLPGGQYRKRDQLAHAHDVLRRIAAGEINARQLPENAALLARHEHESVAVAAVVLHLPLAQMKPRSAA
jgi:WhiB family redox-sensing transcriptional regulator